MTQGVPGTVTFDGVTYPSHSALSRATGLPRSTVSGAVRRKAVSSLGVGRAEGIRRAQKAICQPVQSGDHKWESQAACARDLGVSESMVSWALNRGRFDALVARRLSGSEVVL